MHRFIFFALLIISIDSSRADDLPADARAIIQRLQQSQAELQKRADTEALAKRDVALKKLQSLQTEYCRQAKLDEAVTARGFIRFLQSRPTLALFQSTGSAAADDSLDGLPDVGESMQVPAQVHEIMKVLKLEMEQIQGKLERDQASQRYTSITGLQQVQKQFMEAAKLDESLAIRKQIRDLKTSGLHAQPDPGTLSSYRGQVGKIILFEVVGTVNGTVYGTDIYTDDSSLATAAVHAGVLKPGEKGKVKVTILPGAEHYPNTFRHGVSSRNWGTFSGSFRVQSLFGGARSSSNAPLSESSSEKGI